ncbi:hypothetical protein Tco_0646448 [Tanacetum coccineum]
MSQEKEAQNKFYKTREDKEIEIFISLENKVKVLDDIVYKTGQSVQTMKMLNRNCKMSFVKPEFLKKAQRANPHLYDIGCYDDNLALMLAPESDETILVKCESLEKELSKRTKNVNNKSFNELSKRFSKLEQHSINLELALQQSQEQLNNDKVWKQNESNSFQELNVKNFEIQDLKAQLQDKDIAINSLAKKDFSKSKSVTTNNVSNDFSNPVTAQILPQNVKSILKNINVIAPEMYKVNIKPNKTRTPQLPQDIRKTNKRVSFFTGVILNTSVSRPQLKSNQLEDRLIEIILFIVDSACSKHMTGNLKLLSNFVDQFMGTVKFGNDQIAPILGYGDLVQGNITIKRVYYVEGLNHNLFSVGQFCDADLEVAFRKSTCYISNFKGNDILTGSRGSDLYSVILQNTFTPNLICLMAKATSSQAWLWYRRLSDLNFDTITCF